ncbi:YiiX/YebB-like N1pC/P60 family cysteine hydrolase [Heyndrickxia oleronia]|jgi:uncharacterized protein YycO|uniref:YiiX/YebB-like N1pC/P60 family cysteine hydrolase n=1 Tax=Heyndrickxia oleronia TaxID=38875 RepID=UPI0009042B68|nr:YiiX/YebB-like N1pC/P60 family cysteine hydrolase [Heyndrickxia oleronia]NYV65620.1 hypothetical protein [Bacillus sp. Gen3]OJH20799.1 hypothetical protein BLX88_00995 [Bacillus obstructivus]MBU5211528.1 hypothetical protein [Heyndrickxia oleronia]MCI1589084.1 hypothetical protein [Heyndrickxia oleronia]MCI1611824.1 hypothetical protein [Heyndrickxia oleronia]
MKKILLSSILAVGLVVSSVPSVFAASDDIPYLNDILQMQPDVTSDELLADVESIAKETGNSQEEILEQIYKELKNDANLAENENRLSGGSGGTVPVGTSTKGNFFYTDSQTAYLNHGHVGLYYASSTIVESVPSAGVRKISTSNRLVDKGGACVKSVTTSTANRNGAANWAYSQIGQKYSYNFATNRSTGHNGAKNCSKLIWSAYKLNGNLDLDKNKGLGVYPRDVRDASGTKLVRNI